MPTEADLAEMDSTIESLISQISHAKEQVNLLNSSILFVMMSKYSYIRIQYDLHISTNVRHSSAHYVVGKRGYPAYSV